MITTRFQCTKAGMKIIRAGYTKFLNMFKTFVLTCRSYTHEKNTVWMDIVIVIARMTRNNQEWPGTWMVNSSSFGSRFGTVRLGHTGDCCGYCITRPLSYISLLPSTKISLQKHLHKPGGVGVQSDHFTWTTRYTFFADVLLILLIYFLVCRVIQANYESFIACFVI